MLLTLLLAAFAWSQEEVPADEQGAASEPAAEVADAAIPDDEDTAEIEDEYDGVFEEAFEDESLDEQTYEDDDDDFIPTEEIPVDEPIPFPSNI